MNTHIKFMQRCLDLALNGMGQVAPNPLVGAVLVHENRIIGEGWHARFGEAHAEVNALKNVKAHDRELIPESTLYVNLEPCSHHGKTPPCADLIIKNKIAKVVVASKDPNPLVAGKGLERLRANGVTVTESVLEKEALDLNKRFYVFHQKQRPFIMLKWAESRDGFMGKKGERTKISNAFTDRVVHKWRSEEMSILIGTETALIDDPQLNVRLWEGPSPVRLVLDKTGRLPGTLNLFNGKIPTLVFTEKQKENRGNIAFVTIDFNENLLRNLLSVLYERQIQSVLVEGGLQLLQSFIDKGLWDEIRVIRGKPVLGRGIVSPFFKGILQERTKLGDDELSIYKPVA
jgi:diaminohydroxyphosphoribosylaminopyrimidine deaminase / 5-amino-6-(5-phosphoribosylamino)uracil reductase